MAAKTTHSYLLWPLLFSLQLLVLISARDSALVEARSDSTISSEPAATQSAMTTYQPLVPKSYNNCYLDPLGSANNINLLEGESGLPIYNKDGFAALIQNETDPYAQLFFKKPKRSKKGIFDLALNGTSPLLYLAIFRDGKVGFVEASSNGNKYHNNGEADYVTTVWSMQCNGTLTAGIIGSGQFLFMAQDNMLIAEMGSDMSLQKRQYTGSGVFGYGIKYGGDPNPPTRCPRNDQTPVERAGAPPPSSNGCGSGYFHWNYKFLDCCNGHDYCYDNCYSIWETCNTNFHSCMSDKCNKLFPDDLLGRSGCNFVAEFFNSVVASRIGHNLYVNASKKRCKCKCKGADLVSGFSTRNGTTHYGDGKSEYCCAGYCIDGTSIGEPGQCLGWNYLCNDFDKAPKCGPTQVLSDVDRIPFESGRGTCYVSGCQWYKNKWSWHCYDCPPGFRSYNKGACSGGKSCVGCYNTGEAPAGDEEWGYKCVKECASS